MGWNKLFWESNYFFLFGLTWTLSPSLHICGGSTMLRSGPTCIVLSMYCTDPIPPVAPLMWWAWCGSWVRGVLHLNTVKVTSPLRMSKSQVITQPRWGTWINTCNIHLRFELYCNKPCPPSNGKCSINSNYISNLNFKKKHKEFPEGSTVFDLITARCAQIFQKTGKNLYPPILRALLKRSVMNPSNDAYVMFFFSFIIFFIKAYVVGIHLNCIDESMQFKWIPTTYAFLKK